jgi:hypothetical protein
MRVLGYTWAGVRAGDLKSAARFFADVLGFSHLYELWQTARPMKPLPPNGLS